MSFTPIVVDYNPLRLQAQPYSIMLSHPNTPLIQEYYSIRPSRLRTNARGDLAWPEWWRTTLLTQCDQHLPIPPMPDTNNQIAKV